MKNQIENRGAPDAAHTPGPWEHDPGIPCSVWAKGIWIASTNVESVHDFNERVANARLIAQAPTLLAENEKLRAGHVVLLEALRRIKEIAQRTTPPYAASALVGILSEAEAAIQQAERT